jgi:hypothetical protein
MIDSSVITGHLRAERRVECKPRSVDEAQAARNFTIKEEIATSGFAILAMTFWRLYETNAELANRFRQEHQA